MTEHEIIQGLIARDNSITKVFFFVKCRPLFYSVMRTVFDYEVDYDEMVNEFYIYLMEDDASKLRNFGYRCSIYMWLKVLAIRFFIKKRSRMIDDRSKETPYEEQGTVGGTLSETTAEYDMEHLFEAMPTKRYVEVIRRLILEDCEPEVLAREMNITTANLYNIKRRAIAQLIRIAFNDINEYGK
ncbi:MAG: sigma-70 family RNA polymerase sigma factor [Prevotella sp.]|nr:sigma-70 family RNA polymerase sigma factor [Prevotella sp.]